MRWSVIAAVLFATACKPEPEPEPEPEDTDIVATDYIDGGTYVPVAAQPEAPVRLVLMGDGLMQGFGASSPELSWIELLRANDDAAYPDFAGIDLNTLFPTIAQVDDFSVGGAVTADLEDQNRLGVDDAFSFPSDEETVVLITAGAVDMRRALTPGGDITVSAPEALDNINEAVTWLQNGRWRAPLRIFLLNFYEPTDGVGVSSCFNNFSYVNLLIDMDAYNTDLRALAVERGVAVVDMAGTFVGHGDNHDDDSIETHVASDPTRWIDDACVYPNDRGHHELRRLFLGALTQQKR